MRIRAATTAMFGLLLVLAACSSSTEPRKELELSAVPTSIMLDGQPVELMVYAWRDFMPISPPDGKPLIVVVSLPDSLPGVSIDHLWVLFGEEVWETAVEHRSETNEWVARGGPKWGPGVSVDVVAQLHDQNGNQFRVRADSVQIAHTW